MDLNQIPRIGSKTISFIEEKIGEKSWQSFYTELQELQFDRLFSLQLDSKVEQEIIKHCYSKKYQFNYSTSLMQSPHVKKIFFDLLALVRKQFVLESNKKELIAYSATTSMTEIARRQEVISKAVAFTTKYDENQLSNIRKLLQQKKTLSPIQEEIIIMCDEELVHKTLKQKLPKKALLVFIQKKDEFTAYAGYDLIRYVYSDESKFICDFEGAGNVIGINWKESIYDVVPELLEQEFAIHKKQLENVLALITDFAVSSDPLNQEILESVISRLELDSAELKVVSRESLEALRKKAEIFVEEELSSRQVSGTELLKLLKSEVSEHLLLREVVENVKEKLASEDKELVDYLNFETILPEIDEDRVIAMEKEVSLRRAESAFERSCDFVNRFLSHRGLIVSAQRFLAKVDFMVGMGKYFAGCSLPRISSHKQFSCMNLKSQLLLSKVNDPESVQAITYYLDNSQTILTGANSGGKTSLLQLLCETQLLAQMGLMVNGVCQVPIYDSIYFFTKSSGTVGSGAFETTLKDLARIAQMKNKELVVEDEEGETAVDRSLVLLDEIESITEPGAAGTLIAATLEWFNQCGDIDVVLVSHLGGVLTEICSNARIDGIEAVALDNSLQLVVDRNPKIGILARSTPQLIVEKLALQNSESKYFAFLQEKMRLGEKSETLKSNVANVSEVPVQRKRVVV
jgi:DNA mismatch repair protein MutS2